MKFGKGLRDRMREANAGDKHYALMYDKEPAFQNSIAPKRAVRATNPDRISEADVNLDIRHAKIPGLTLYRNNRGQVILPSGGRLTYGVGPNGGSDWIGRYTVRITQEMVGQRFARFVAIEAKAPDAGKPRDDQVAFIDDTIAAGGIAGFVRTLDDLLLIVR